MTPRTVTDHATAAARVVVAALVVASLLATPVAADRPVADRPALTTYELQETVIVDGTEYAIYEYDSPLPYVGGLAVYRGGEPVLQQETVATVLKAHARQEAVAGLRSDELRTIRRLRDRSRAIEARVTPLIERLNATLAYADGLKNESVDDRTAWAAAINASPAFEDAFTAGFSRGASGVAELRNELLVLKRATSTANDTATTVLELAQKRRNGVDVNKTRLFRRYTELLRAVERTTDLADDLDGRLADTADRTAKMAAATGDVPRVGPELRDRFTALTDALRATSERLAAAKAGAIADRKALNKVDRRAATISDRMVSRWEPRGTIEAKVNGTIGESVLVVLAGLLTVARTRRELQ